MYSTPVLEIAAEINAFGPVGGGEAKAGRNHGQIDFASEPTSRQSRIIGVSNIFCLLRPIAFFEETRNTGTGPSSPPNTNGAGTPVADNTARLIGAPVNSGSTGADSHLRYERAFSFRPPRNHDLSRFPEFPDVDPNIACAFPCSKMLPSDAPRYGTAGRY